MFEVLMMKTHFLKHSNSKIQEQVFTVLTENRNNSYHNSQPSSTLHITVHITVNSLIQKIRSFTDNIPKPTMPERKDSHLPKGIVGLAICILESIEYAQTQHRGGDPYAVVSHRAPWLHGGYLKPPAVMGQCQDRQTQPWCAHLLQQSH